MLVTPFFAAVLALFYVILSLAVVRQRLLNQVNLGDGDLREVRTAIRVHGNFSEYVPLGLLLMWFIETVMFESTFVLILGCLLLVGRALHVVGMYHPKRYLVLRQIGMVMTLTVLIVAASRLLWHYVPI